MCLSLVRKFMVLNELMQNIINQKINFMEANKNQADKAKLNDQSNNRPQNKDDLDSRANEEQLSKGDDETNNKKEQKSEKKN